VPPVGKVLDPTRITLQPVPGGRPGDGEILIAGNCLCDGYLYRPELNAEKFLKLEDGRRYYRTGDLGRILEDGNLQFLGRIATS
jgi:non-ribosomal peptide synthetase component F